MTFSLQDSLDEHLALFQCLPSLTPALEQAATQFAADLQSGRKLMLGGNGGSAVDSPHIAAEFTVVPSTTIARIQETHVFRGHALCGWVEQLLQLA
jgi:phosphoheptose isomerase